MEPHGTCVAFVWPRPLRPEAKRRFPVAAGLSLCLSLALSAAFRTAKRRKRTSGGRLARFSNPGAPRVRDGDGAWLDATRGEGGLLRGSPRKNLLFIFRVGLARAAAVVGSALVFYASEGPEGERERVQSAPSPWGGWHVGPVGGALQVSSSLELRESVSISVSAREQ